MRIDLHVHSKFSKRPSQWVLQKIGCPESFAEPGEIHRVAKDRGMSMVTICDHNTIDGALEIAHLNDAFISEEITSYFPNDHCKVHILALNITEQQHVDIQKIRENVFELVPYLTVNKILHVMAHPLYPVNDRLKIEHVEQALLLFKNFEINGARNNRENQCLQQIVGNLTPEIIDRLADKHNIYPSFPTPWVKHLVGGSDDHSALNIARSHTEIKGAYDLDSFFRGISAGEAQAICRPSTPITMAHNLYSIAYQYYRDKFNLDRYSGKDILIKFLDRSLLTRVDENTSLMSKLIYFCRHRKRARRKAFSSDDLAGFIRSEASKLIQDTPELLSITKQHQNDFQSQEQKWFEFVNITSNRMMLHFGDHLMDHLSGANVFNIFHTIGSAGGIYTLLAPYFVAYTLFAGDRQFNDQLLMSLTRKANPSNQPINIAHFTDTFYETNGVALNLRNHLQMALKKHKKLTVITCDTAHHGIHKGIRNYRPIGVYDLPDYPDQKIFYPPLLEMLHDCYAEKYNQIQVATPGPIGLAALAIARILKLPIQAIYHANVSQYVQTITDDESVEDLAWKYIVWFYDQMDAVFVPSQSARHELIAKGLRPEKIRHYPRGIDLEFFHPGKRNGYLEKRYAIRNKTTLLYVGRISKEKNLHLLATAFKKLCQNEPNIHLMVVGDGPYRQEMKNTLQNAPCTFTGFIQGDQLATIYASCDLFVFPSASDTFGSVVLEAQASGLPVIVTDKGGPQENMLPDKTGLVATANDSEHLSKTIRRLLKKPKKLQPMGKAAREYVEKRSIETTFLQTWDMYRCQPLINNQYESRKAS